MPNKRESRDHRGLRVSVPEESEHENIEALARPCLTKENRENVEDLARPCLKKKKHERIEALAAKWLSGISPPSKVKGGKDRPELFFPRS